MGNGICCSNQNAILNTISSINNQNKPIISNASENSKVSNKSLNLIIPYNAFNNIFFIVENIIKIQSFYRGCKLREVFKTKLTENKNIVIQIPLNCNLTKISTTENNENSNNEHLLHNERENTNNYLKKNISNSDNISNKSSLNIDKHSNKILNFNKNSKSNNLNVENYSIKNNLNVDKYSKKNILNTDIYSIKDSLNVDDILKKDSLSVDYILKKHSDLSEKHSKKSSEKNKEIISNKFSKTKIKNNKEINFHRFSKSIKEIYEEDDILSEISNSSISSLSKPNSLSPKTTKTIYSLNSFSSLMQSNTPLFISSNRRKGFILNNRSLFNQFDDNNLIEEINGYFLLKNQKINLSKIKDGFNIIKLKDGSYIKSTFKNKEINGIAKFYDKEREITYNGYYKKNIPFGYALLQYDKGKFEGYFKKNYIIDSGIEIWSDQTYYQGQYLNNKKNGIGFYRWPDGTTYEGEWENNKMNGYGIFTYFDDRAYSGKIINGFMNGIGIFKWKNGNFYFGEYENDVKNGFGIYVWKKKPLNAFCGFFVKGVRDGFGMRIIGNDVRYGMWKDGYIDEWINGIWELKKYMKKDCFGFRKYFKKDFFCNYVKNFNIDECFYTIVKVKM